jgi:hypothetical protein
MPSRTGRFVATKAVSCQSMQLPKQQRLKQSKKKNCYVAIWSWSIKKGAHVNESVASEICLNESVAELHISDTHIIQNLINVANWSFWP